jgi:hypothetical protein
MSNPRWTACSVSTLPDQPTRSKEHQSRLSNHHHLSSPTKHPPHPVIATTPRSLRTENRAQDIHPPLSSHRNRRHKKSHSSSPAGILRSFSRDSPPIMTDRMIIGTNPLPSNPTPLSAPQEQQVRDLYYKNVRAKCAEEIESMFSCFPCMLATSYPRSWIYIHVCVYIES